jgi:hypothetical protein
MEICRTYKKAHKGLTKVCLLLHRVTYFMLLPVNCLQQNNGSLEKPFEKKCTPERKISETTKHESRDRPCRTWRGFKVIVC